MGNSAIKKKLVFIGAGQMAEALIGGLLAAQVCETALLWATDSSAERRDVIKQRFGIRVGDDNKEAARWADAVVLAVKPQMLDHVVAGLGAALDGRLVISIAAGISLSWLASRVPASARLVRVMPNMPALVREGMAAFTAGPGVQTQDLDLVRTLFESVGRAVPVEERLMDAVTGLSGSGPAYVFLIIEAMADGGVKAGLPRQTAEVLAAQTVLGAARQLIESGEHPARLKDKVASPGGTTIAGLHQLEIGGLRAALIAAIEAATIRSRELGA